MMIIFQKNTFTEKLDLTDNYIEAPGAIALANMLLDNCFLTDIVSFSPNGSQCVQTFASCTMA